MYTSICSKEKWHREGDVFCRQTSKHFEAGVVYRNENSDTLSINWDESETDTNESILSGAVVDFSYIDFKKTFLIDQNFSLGEIAVDDRRQQLGEVVGKSWFACASIFETEYVIPNIPSELLTPEVILEGGSVLLRGWIGEITQMLWEVTVQEETGERKVKLNRIKSSKKYGYLRKKIIPAVGRMIDIRKQDRPCLVKERKLAKIYVRWYHRLQFYPNSSSPSSLTPPPSKIRDRQLLSELVDFDWNNYNNCKKHTLCSYTIRDTDIFLSENWEDIILSEMAGLTSDSIPCKKQKMETPFKIGEKVLVNVLRIFNVAHLEWQDTNGKLFPERMLTKDIKHQNRFTSGEVGCFRAFVSHKLSFGSGRLKTLGVTLRRNEADETVFVNWLTKPGEELSNKPENESKHDLVGHKLFCDIQIGQCVERSSSCTHKDFIVGIIKDILEDGFVNVVMDASGDTVAKLIPSDFIICPTPFENQKKEFQCVKFETVKPPLSNYPPEFFKALTRDVNLMRDYAITNPGIDIPPAINTDICSLLFYGPVGTPYECGIFIFQFQFPYSYPYSPPIVKLLPLFEKQINSHCMLDGTLLRKLRGRMLPFPTPFLWSEKVTLLDIVITIKSFIFTDEPFIHSFQDWDYGLSLFDVERIKIHRIDSLRQYNAGVIMEIMDSLLRLKYELNETNSIDVWKPTILRHLKIALPKLRLRLLNWVNSSSIIPLAEEHRPRFTLLPLSQGLKMAIRERIDHLNHLSQDLLC